MRRVASVARWAGQYGHGTTARTVLVPQVVPAAVVYAPHAWTAARFAGHSKWHNMRHRKADVDKKRSTLFSKLCREITAAAKAGPDPTMNIRLAYAIDRGKAANLPRDNIENAIKRATESSSAEAEETVWYEGRGPGGTAVLIKALTENRKRTAPALRSIFSKSGGELGVSGSVSWMFDTFWRCNVSLEGDVDADEVMDVAIEGGADDVEVGDEAVVVTTSDAKTASALRDALADAGFTPDTVAVDREPQSTVELSGDVEESFANFLDALDDNEDVQEVYHNAENVGDDDDTAADESSD